LRPWVHVHGFMGSPDDGGAHSFNQILLVPESAPSALKVRSRRPVPALPLWLQASVEKVQIPRSTQCWFECVLYHRRIYTKVHYTSVVHSTVLYMYHCNGIVDWLSEMPSRLAGYKFHQFSSHHRHVLYFN